MEKYVAGFVIPLLKDKIEECRRIAEKAGAIWKEHGAQECWGSIIYNPSRRLGFDKLDPTYVSGNGWFKANSKWENKDAA